MHKLWKTRATVAAALALGMAGTACGLPLPEGASTSTPANSEVIHVSAVMEVFDGEGRLGARQVHELWFDPDTMDTHYVVESANGDRRTSIRRGRDVSRYNHRTDHLMIVTAPSDDSPMLNVADPLLAYRRGLEGGEMQQISEGLVDGRPAVEVTVEHAQAQEYGRFIAWLDAETLMPLEVTFYEPAGDMRETIVWTYTTLESVAPEQVPADAFLFDPPAGATFSGDRYITLEEARRLDMFDTYYLGETYDGLSVTHVVHRHNVSPVDGSQIERLDIIYGEDFIHRDGQDRIVLVHRPGEQRQPRTLAPGMFLEREVTTAAGHEVVLYGDDCDLDTVNGDDCDLDAVIGNAWIVIHNQERQRLLDMVGDLRKLN